MVGKTNFRAQKVLGFVLIGYQDHLTPGGLPPLSLRAVAHGSPTSGV